MDISNLDFEKGNGLIPAIIQDAQTNQVLMLGYMNQEAIQKTLETKKVTFYSRSKQRLWTKGESSGHSLELVQMQPDCDQDALLVEVKPNGPTCHTGQISCFHQQPHASLAESETSFLFELEQLLYNRKKELPENSYTSTMFKKGENKVAQKVGEEAVETVIAALKEQRSDFVYESSDLLFHLLMLLVQKEVRFSELIDELESRHS